MRNHSYENDFDLLENETTCRTYFHMEGFTLRLRGSRELGNGLLNLKKALRIILFVVNLTWLQI